MSNTLVSVGLFFGLLTGLSCATNAQSVVQPPAAAVPHHVVRSISPADQDFTDLEFLRREIGSARVVMLGEPTHGEGNVTEAKVRLTRFLQQRMGFTTVAFESGFYELDRGQRAIEAGVPVREAVEGGVFPIWTGTQEFQALLPLLGKGGLRIAGFDYQLSGPYQDDLVEELETFLKPEKGADGIAYDYLDECLSTMGESFIFPPTHQPALFQLQMGKVRRLLEKVATGPNAARRERAAFWLQNVRSLQALAQDYVKNDPGAKGETEFKAVDSNPRDAQMADNLLWYLRQHPREKVICWGALPHLANKAEVLDDDEISAYRPMGRAVKAALGEDAVYVLGTLAGGGTYMDAGNKAVPVPAAGSLEADLLALGQEYSFVSLKHDAAGKVLTTYAFQYQPLTGPWSSVVDGFLFLKSVHPTHPATVVAESPVDTTRTRPVALANTAVGRLNPARRPTSLAKGGAAFALQGVVLDGRTARPVPFATVAVPARAAGTVADAQGRFTLATRAGETVQVSSVGYEAAVLSARDANSITVRLKPTAYALSDVRVSAASQDPRKIMQKVIKAAPTNYEQQDYTAQVYTHRRSINFDTLRAEVEYVSQIFEPAGYRHWAGGFLGAGPGETHRVLEKHQMTPSDRSAQRMDYIQTGQGFLTASADPVRISPLFKANTLRKFILRLDTIEQRGSETFYVIRFAAKRATHRSTGTYLTAGYSGKVYIREQDYAVVRYEALWQHDTVQYNAVARKYQGRGNIIASLYKEVFSDERTAHVVTYQKAANGRYHVATSVAQGLSVGHVLGGKPFYSQKYCEEHFTPLPTGTPIPPPNPLIKDTRLASDEIIQLQYTEYHPEFWQTYQRPVSAEPAPELQATKKP